MNGNMKIVFVSTYIEPLKVFLYFAEHLTKKGYTCIFICQYDDENTRLENKKLMESYNYEYELYHNVFLPDTKLWVQSFFFRLSLLFLYPFYLNLKSRIQASKIIARHNPNVCIFSSETNNLCRQLVFLSNKSKIPTFLHQWGFSSPSKRIAKQVKAVHNLTESTIQRLLIRIVTLPNAFLNRIFGLHSSLKRTTKLGGGGGCKKHLVISNAAARFYHSTGVKASKLEVVGHPVFEDLYKNLKKGENRGREKILKDFSIPKDSKIILWANTQLKHHYDKFHSPDEFEKSFIEKFISILNIDSKIHIIFKLHPSYVDAKSHHSYINKFDNVRMTNSSDLIELLSISDLFVSSYSTSVNYALLSGIPTITFDFPIIPGSDRYEILGGTLHSKNIEAFESNVRGVFSNDSNLLKKYYTRRNIFLEKYLGLNDMRKSILSQSPILPSNALLERQLLREI